MSRPDHARTTSATRPSPRFRRRTAAVLSACLMLPPVAAAQGPPLDERALVDATVRFLRGTDDNDAESFVARHLSPAYRDAIGSAELVRHLLAIRAAARGHLDEIAVEASDGGVQLLLGATPARTIDIDFSGRPPQIDRIALAEGTAAGEPSAASAGQQRARAIEALGRGSASDALDEFVRLQTTTEFRQSPAHAALAAALPRVRRAIASAGTVNLSVEGDATTLSFRGGVPLDVVFELEPTPPYRIRSLAVVEPAPDRAEPPAPDLTWDGLEAYFAHAATQGFSGYVLARHRGRTILDRGFAPDGLIAPRRDTVFDIGSYPIVFTQAAVLLLAQQGRLQLDDPLQRWFPDAPADKRDITLRQLLDGRSGLPNFHGDPTRDRDPDLSPLSRSEALRRIFDAPLLFPAGSESSFSHSGYGLLAAVVEQVSGDSYRDFLTRELLRPAGLTRTGFYGDDLGLPFDAFALGHGSAAAEPNVPPLWGPTSWLILGSGGMVSTVPELQRFHSWIQAGGLLRAEFRERFEQSRLAAGGTERGFLTVRGWDGEDSEILVAANPLPRWPDRQALPAAMRTLLER